MGVFNILLGAYMEQAGQDVTVHLKEVMRNELLQAGVQIGQFEIATTKESISEQIATNRFDVVVCQESLSGVSIGGGTLKEWNAINAHVKVILLIDIEKKKGLKLQNLYSKNNYYDALYTSDLSGECLAGLITQSRSREDAFLYYGLNLVEEMNSNESNKRTQQAAAKLDIEATDMVVENKNMESGASVTGKENSTAGVYTSASDESTMDEFNEALKQMEHYFETEGTDSFAAGMPGASGEVASGVHDKVFEEDNLFGGDTLFRNTMRNRMPEDVETQEAVLKEFGDAGHYVEEQKRNQSTNVVVKPASGMRSNLTHVKGQIVEVISPQLLMVKLNEQTVIDEESVTGYKLTLLIESGMKGHMENGRFRTGVLSLKTYGNCMIDDYHVIVEACDRDLYEVVEQIMNKHCNIIVNRV